MSCRFQAYVAALPRRNPGLHKPEPGGREEEEVLVMEALPVAEVVKNNLLLSYDTTVPPNITAFIIEYLVLVFWILV